MTLVPLPTGAAGPEDAPAPLDCAAAESLGERIQQQAAVIAASTCDFLLMIAEFEAGDALRWFVGLKSLAHWLSWSCSMAPGTAREHVRVARALRAMPLTVTEFAAGRLSYSKVREMTRAADRVDETVLVEMARAMTASQLSRTIGAFRAVAGSRMGQDANRRADWYVREDGMIEIRAVLPAEVGAELMTALELAMDRDESGPPAASAPGRSSAERAESTEPTEPVGPAALTNPTDLTDPANAGFTAARSAEITTTPTLEQRKADALHSLARTYLAAEDDDRSGEDRHLVIVQVSAEALAQDVPAGTSLDPSADTRSSGTSSPGVPSPEALSPDTPTLDPTSPGVPAGTPPQCGVLGAGPLEPATAERLACTGKLSIEITDAGGEILHLGRSRRLASRAQRRALRLRDTTCVFPGCHQSKHLDAHHLVPWSDGGPTDLEGLGLLCRRHHVMVHEGGMRLVPASGRSTPHQPRFEVLDCTGRPVQARWPAMLEDLNFLEQPGRTAGSPANDGPPTDAPATGEPTTGNSAAVPQRDPDPGRIAATTGGFGFRLADCVDALCQNIVERAGPDPVQDPGRRAA